MLTSPFTRAFLGALASLLLAAAQAPGPADPPWRRWDGQRYVVHEWGTFTSVQGSGGVVLDGLLHEERDLPGFVHDLSDRLGLTARAPKMETPVIYFYAPERWRIAVDVGFPRGLITQWYPAAGEVNCRELTAGADAGPLQDGFVRWGAGRELLVLAPGEEPLLEPVSADDPWAFQRDVEANALRVCGVRAVEGERFGSAQQYERMLFYRGLGDFELPLRAEVHAESLQQDRATVQLFLENTAADGPCRELYLVLVEDGRAGFTRLPDLVTSLAVGPLELQLGPVNEVSARLAEQLAESLTDSGLYADEARAMVRTWRRGWFEDEGLRLLYVLPRACVERELPLSIEPHEVWDSQLGAPVRYPAADELVRTFIGRADLLSPRREAQLTAAVRAWSDGDPEERAAARAEILRWGRFAVPYLERVFELTGDAQVAEAVRRELDRLRPQSNQPSTSRTTDQRRRSVLGRSPRIQ